ncbi:MAG TPA: FAD-dependent oxidoreductase [Gaiella sp.]|nr:FAD-dependent oxidoreductase [Gaiella sp.]
MRQDADIVVVGAGIAGVATASALAGYKGSVVLLEQFELGHERGSSHGTSRIFRLNYPDERFVRLAMAADEAWRKLEAERGEHLIERVGSLDLGPVAAETGRALASCGVPYETLSAQEIGARWPLRLEPGETAVFQPDGGVTYADRAHATLVAEAVQGGVEVREETPVRSLAIERNAVRLALDSGELTARAVVVAAGAWGPALLAPLGIELPVVPTRETVVYVALPGAEALPPVIDYGRLPPRGDGGISRVGQSSYGLAAPGRGLKAGLHHSGPRISPDSAPAPDERLATWVAAWVASRFDGAGEVLGLETCLYTNTADEEFVLERHGRVVVGSACSGHGFKFAPVVGRTLAALAREAAVLTN